MIAPDYPLFHLFWITPYIFMFVTWIILIQVFTDNSRRNDHSGWAKAGWTLVILRVPLVGVSGVPDLAPEGDRAGPSVDRGLATTGALPGSRPRATIAKARELNDGGVISTKEFREPEGERIGLGLVSGRG